VYDLAGRLRIVTKAMMKKINDYANDLVKWREHNAVNAQQNLFSIG